ncbi:MAG: class I SAM-dependent methyltransferase [Proteobacteria bacterium]|nr:class I SAM-dependent methyltransferase [Pseudomonadota bacterium]
MLGLPTVLGLTPGGWFIPHRYAPLLAPPGAQPPYAAIEVLFEEKSAAFGAMLDLLDGRAAEFEAMRGLFDQAWFPSLDAAMAYTLVRERKPLRIVEIGSGHSTRVLAKASAGVAEILAIDPAPRADIAGLPGVTIVPSTLQAAPTDLFDRLQGGDLLFIDSSHILMPGSDVDYLLNRVLPRLPARTLVHIHDIYLPFDYPAMWGWRNYNEQQGVLPLLTTGAYTPLFSSVWAERRLGDRLARSVVPRLPRPADALAASLWLEKR